VVGNDVTIENSLGPEGFGPYHSMLHHLNVMVNGINVAINY